MDQTAIILWIIVTVSAYNPLPGQTDSTPLITASNQAVRQGICALSRDLEKWFNLRFGDLIYLEGIGTCEFQDRMNKRKRNQVDLFMWNEIDAVEFGIKERTRMKIIKRRKLKWE